MTKTRTTTDPFSSFAIKEYLLVIQAILASYEVSLANDPTQDRLNMLRVSYLEKEFGTSKLIHAMKLLDQWLKGTPFSAQTFYFHKKNTAQWATMLDVVRSKLERYSMAPPVMTLVLTLDGDIFRFGNTIADGKLKYDSRELNMLLRIVSRSGYIKTKDLAQSLQTTEAAIRQTRKKINAHFSRIYKIRDLIEGESGSGYRKNPKYEIVVLGESTAR